MFLQWSNWFKTFWCKVVKNWQKRLQEDIDICYIGYVTVKKIANYNNINSVMINEMIGLFEEKNGNKY